MHIDGEIYKYVYLSQLEPRLIDNVIALLVGAQAYR